MIERRFVLIAAAATALAGAAQGGPMIGMPAPAFSAVDADGRVRSLDEFKGRTVVLEWTNNGCPYVRRNYSTGAMQDAQRKATAHGVVWLTVASSPPGAQGHITGPQAKAWQRQVKAAWSDI